MKVFKILTFITAAVLIVSVVAMGDLASSKHGFSAAWAAGGGKCGPCHTPHNADSSDTPLWSHTNTTTAGWTMYSNGTMNASMPAAPRDLSLMCLSCHDGTVALEAFIGSTNGTTTYIGSVNASASMSKDLSNDHPISFLYNQALADADGELHSPTGTPAVASLLFGGYLECSSCHDAHGGTAGTKMLVMANSSSELCLTCHNK